MLISSGEIFQLKDKVSVKISENDEDLAYPTVGHTDQDWHTSVQILDLVAVGNDPRF